MSGITIQISAASNGGAFLGKAAAGLAAMDQPMAELAAAELIATHERFDKQVAPSGVPWIKSARKAGDNKPTLFQSGDLRRFITQDSGADFAQVGVANSAGPAKYAARHNDGGTFRSGFSRKKPDKNGDIRQGPGRGIVAIKRQFIGEDDGTRRRIEMIFSDWIKEVFAAADQDTKVQIT